MLYFQNILNISNFCDILFFLQISFVLLEFPAHFPQNLFPSNFLHFEKNSFGKEISFNVEALETNQFNSCFTGFDAHGFVYAYGR
jgi:hypothetical protein